MVLLSNFKSFRRNIWVKYQSLKVFCNVNIMNVRYKLPFSWFVYFVFFFEIKWMWKYFSNLCSLVTVGIPSFFNSKYIVLSKPIYSPTQICLCLINGNCKMLFSSVCFCKSDVRITKRKLVEVLWWQLSKNPWVGSAKNWGWSQMIIIAGEWENSFFLFSIVPSRKKNQFKQLTKKFALILFSNSSQQVFDMFKFNNKT